MWTTVNYVIIIYEWGFQIAIRQINETMAKVVLPPVIPISALAHAYDWITLKAPHIKCTQVDLRDSIYQWTTMIVLSSPGHLAGLPQAAHGMLT